MQENKTTGDQAFREKTIERENESSRSIGDRSNVILSRTKFRSPHLVQVPTHIPRISSITPGLTKGLDVVASSRLHLLASVFNLPEGSIAQDTPDI
jgi:hypothetical protein